MDGAIDGRREGGRRRWNATSVKERTAEKEDTAGARARFLFERYEASLCTWIIIPLAW